MIVVLRAEAIMGRLIFQQQLMKQIIDREGRFLIGAPGRKGGTCRQASNDLVTLFYIFTVTHSRCVLHLMLLTMFIPQIQNVCTLIAVCVFVELN
jgi:hypothetical protein